MGKRRDQKDCARILKWVLKSLRTMRLPPYYVQVNADDFPKDRACIAMIKTSKTYLDLTIRVNLKQLRKMPLAGQRRTLTHELAHPLSDRCIVAYERWGKSMLEYVPSKHHKKFKRPKKEARREEEKLTDHIAYLIANLLPEWKGI